MNNSGWKAAGLGHQGRRSALTGERNRGLSSIRAIVVFAFVAASSVAPSVVSAEPALPGESCRINSLQGWTKPEQWAWKQICQGRTADFNRHLNDNLDPGDSSHLGKWRDGRRTLSPIFLKTVLLYEPFRGAVHFHGVRIVGAYVHGDINLSDAVTERFLSFNGSFFTGSVYMMRFSTPRTLSFDNARVTGTLDMDSSAIGGDLLLGAAKLADVVLRGAEIGQQLSMTNATVSGTLNMGSATTGGSLFLGDAKLADVVLRGAEIGDQLDLVSATVTGTLDMDSSAIGGSLLLRNAKLVKVDLRAAKIGDRLSMDGAIATGKLSMDSVVTGEGLFLRNATLPEVNLLGAEIGQQLSMTGATVTGTLDMDSSAIGGSLFLRNAKLAQVDMRGAEIGEQLSMTGATVTGTLNMYSSAIGGSLLLRDAEFADVKLPYASIGSNLDARGALLSRLDLTGTQIEGELRLGTGGWEIAWKGCDDRPNNSPVPRLTLQNVTADALQDTVTAWPRAGPRGLDRDRDLISGIF